jgi:hypothetical protein
VGTAKGEIVSDNPGKWPFVKADNPVRQWNTLRVRMVGPRVWIWLNGDGRRSDPR